MNTRHSAVRCRAFSATPGGVSDLKQHTAGASHARAAKERIAGRHGVLFRVFFYNNENVHEQYFAYLTTLTTTKIGFLTKTSITINHVQSLSVLL